MTYIIKCLLKVEKYSNGTFPFIQGIVQVEWPTPYMLNGYFVTQIDIY